MASTLCRLSSLFPRSNGREQVYLVARDKEKQVRISEVGGMARAIIAVHLSAVGRKEQP